MGMLNQAVATKPKHKKKHPKTGVESGQRGSPVSAPNTKTGVESGDAGSPTGASGNGGAQETYQTPDQSTQIQQSGPPPVINPAAPGAGDESGGSDTPGSLGGQGQDQSASAGGAQDSDQDDSDQSAGGADQDQGQDQDQDSDSDQGGGAQSDDDSDSDQSDDNAPPSGGAAAGGSPAASGGGASAPKGAHIDANGTPQIPISPALKEEYQRANQMLYQLLYNTKGDPLATGVMRGLMPQGPMKIKSAVMVSLTVLTQLHKRLGGAKQFPPQLVLPLTKSVVSHVLELGETVKHIQYSPQELTAILGSALESVLRIFGVSKKQIQTVRMHIPRSVLQKHLQNYQAAHKFAKPALDANAQGWHNDSLAAQHAQQTQGQQGTTQPAPAGPQTGAPVGAPPPAPPQGAPGPQPQAPAAGAAPAGGMLTQAAQGGGQ
jgi:hypothetical protein